ncbi:hypothetical protein T484DRAFT_1814519 [Baffinella frigidus]|nr:hypothetical protein T484DRAFT_1814519 [Cryptophyta sp. CCMP2293]
MLSAKPWGLTNSTTSYSRDPLSSSNVYGSDRVPGGGPSWDSSQTSDRSNQPVRQPGSSGTSDSLAASGALAQQRAVFASNYSSAQQYLAATAASGRVGATDLSGSAAGQGQGGAPVRGGEGLSLSTINTRSSGDVRGEVGGSTRASASALDAAPPPRQYPVGGSTRASASELNAAPPLHVAPPPRQYPGGAQPYAPTGRFSDMYGSNRVDPSERATVSTPTTAASQTPGGPPGQPGSSGGAGTGGAGTSGAGLGFSALGMREAHRGPLVSSHADRMRPIQVA